MAILNFARKLVSLKNPFRFTFIMQSGSNSNVIKRWSIFSLLMAITLAPMAQCTCITLSFRALTLFFLACLNDSLSINLIISMRKFRAMFLLWWLFESRVKSREATLFGARWSRRNSGGTCYATGDRCRWHTLPLAFTSKIGSSCLDYFSSLISITRFRLTIVSRQSVTEKLSR